MYRNAFGGCLADDMGLGKTLQTIALLQYIADENEERKTSLVVMPTSLIFNWQHELERFAPGLRVYAYTGSKRAKDRHATDIFPDYDVVLTTYGTLRNDAEKLSAFPFHHLILDESQYIKNPESLTYKAVKKINAQHKLSLTGTPIENSLTDLWAQFNILNEGMLGSQATFKKRYVNPIERNDEQQEERLLHLIQPFMLRRTKAEVTPELPPLTEELIYCEMSEAQAACYKTERNKLRNNLLSADIWESTQQRTLLTLQGLTRLRLAANHPRFIDGDYNGDSGKFEQALMHIETLIAEGHKMLIFSSFVRHLRLFSEYFDSKGMKYAWLTGSTLPAEREREINRFMTEGDVPCFFVSLKAGGVGLNLTVADYVFILDPWWNPASEMQAISRSHRIGQQKSVMVYRFISSGSIEEKIRFLQENKSKLAEKFVASANPFRQMEREDIEELLG